MPAVSNCPKCDAQVSIPLGAPGETEVRCPLCSEEYLLQEALDKAPPDLILVNPPEAGEVPAFAAGVGAAGGADDVESESAGFDFFGEAGELKLEDETPSFSFGDDEGSGAASAEGGTATATKPQVRKKRKGPGPMFQVAGIVGGGVIGLTAGYFILLWVFHKDIGQEFGLAASKIFPAAMVPEALHEENAESVKPADEDDGAGTGDAGPGVGTGGATGSPVVDSRESFEEAFGGGKKTETAAKEKVDDPPAPTKPPDSDPFSIDPSPVDPLPKGPSVEPPKSPPSEPKVGLKSAPSFTSDQLGAAITAVLKSSKALEESDKTGDEIKPLKVQLFQDFCALGEFYTFAEGEADDGMFQARLAAAVRLAGKSADGKFTLDEIGWLAGAWLSKKNREDGGGLLLAGTVDDVVNSGDLFKVTVMLAGTKQGQVVVLCAENPKKLSQLDEVLILGHIVDAPKEKLHDFTGDESIVVWSRAKGIVLAGN